MAVWPAFISSIVFKLRIHRCPSWVATQDHQLLIDLALDPFSFDRLEFPRGIAYFLLVIRSLAQRNVLKEFQGALPVEHASSTSVTGVGQR